MSGMINLALTQQLDEYGEPLDGGQLYIIQAGTISTPQQPYQDSALSIVMPNPIPLDAMGRIPQFFLADGLIKVRLQDQNGIVKFVADNLLVIGPSSGGGGGGGTVSVDPTTILSTGDVKARYDTAILTGWVRCNGKTIGSSSSGATELADPSAQALFLFLWTVDATLTVSGGRGASASADWTANKQIALPDFRARAITGLADMGNTDVGLLAGITFTHGNTITLGSQAGNGMHSIPVGALPSHQHPVFATVTDPKHQHTTQTGTSVLTQAGNNTNLNYLLGASVTGLAATGITVNAASAAGLNDNQTALSGAGGTMDMTDPMMLITVYIKL